MSISIDSDLPGGWAESPDMDFDTSIVGSELPEGWPEDDLTTDPVEQVITGEEGEGAA